MIGTAEDHHSNPLKIALGEVQARGRPLHLDQPGAHRLLGDRRRVDPDQARHRRRALHGAPARADRERPGATMRSSSASPTRRSWWCSTTATGEGLFAFDPDPERGPPGDGRTSAQQAGVGQGDGSVKRRVPRRHRRRLRPGPRRPLHAGRRHAASRLRSSCCASASRAARRSGPQAITGIAADAHPQARARDGRDGAAAGLRAADSVDRCLGQAASDDAGAPGRLPCDARAGRAFQRLPDGARARGADERARHHRRARRLPAQGAVSAPHRAQLPRLQCARDDPAEHAAATRRRWAFRPTRTSWRSTPTARRSASTRPSRGSIRCRRTA